MYENVCAGRQSLNVDAGGGVGAVASGFSFRFYAVAVDRVGVHEEFRRDFRVAEFRRPFLDFNEVDSERVFFNRRAEERPGQERADVPFGPGLADYRDFL